MGVDRAIDITAKQRKIVTDLLERHLPNTTAWVYGSRAKWASRPQSDLDLVVFATPKQNGRVSDLREALEESNLPFRVDLFVWDAVPEQFRKQIKSEHVVLVEKEELDTTGEWRETICGRFASDFVEDCLANLCDPINGIQTGPFGSQLHKKDYVSVGTPIITVEHLGDNRILYEDVPHVSDHDRERLSKYILHDGDIVFSRVGSVDRRALVKESESGWLFSGRCLRIRPDPKKIDSGYLSYFFGLPSFKEHIRAIAVGATMPSLNTQILSDIVVPHPRDLNEQRAIAHILGTLDDKIELNRRMNETLEAMARALFKSWFVDFDPVRAKIAGHDTGLPQDLADLFPDRLVDSELGKIPEGWEVKALEEFGDVITGKTPSTRIPEFYGDDVPFLKIPDMHGQMYVVETSTMLSSVGASSQALKTLPSGSISVSCIATPGLVVLNHRNIQTNQQINSVIPRNPLLSKYLYWSCRHLSTNIKTGGLGGSVFGNMNKSTFSALPVLNPESAAIRAFDQFVSPIHAAMLANEEQNQTLAEGRDSLLPKLISGELRPQVAKRIVEIA